MDDRRDGVEEGERVLAGQRADRSARAGEVSGPVATMTLSQSAGGSADFAALEGDERVRRERRGDGGGKALAVDGQRAARRHLMGVGGAHDQRAEPAQLLVQQADRVVSWSSERNELEQTSSAQPSVLCGSVARSGRISCRTTGTPACANCQAASEPARPPPMTWTG